MFGMRVLDVPVAPCVVGMILGPLAEQQFRRALSISQGETLRDLFPDRSALHATYDEWEADARRVERQLGAQGLAVERIIVDPAEFSGWCALRGLEPDGAARSRFTTEALRARHKTS